MTNRGKRRSRLRGRRTRAWLMTQVKDRLEADRQESAPTFSEWARNLVLPDTRVGGLAAGLVALLLPVSWLLAIWSPEFLADAPGLSAVTPDRSKELLGVLWQVHVAVAAIALPLLVFSIDLAGNRPGVAATTQEVLIRESFIFPILAFGLALAVRV